MRPDRPLWLSRVLTGKIPEHWQFEHDALRGFDHQNQPDDDRGKADHHGDQQDQQRSEYRDYEKNDAGELKRDRDQNFRAAEHEALDGMEAQEAIALVRLEEQEDDRWDEGEIGECARDIFRKNADRAVGARL